VRPWMTFFCGGTFWSKVAGTILPQVPPSRAAMPRNSKFVLRDPEAKPRGRRGRRALRENRDAVYPKWPGVKVGDQSRLFAEGDRQKSKHGGKGSAQARTLRATGWLADFVRRVNAPATKDCRA